MTDRHSWLLPSVIALSIVVGLAARVLTGWPSPLWLDEAFTGAIARQPTFAGLVQDCLNELSGPVYYGLIWCWEKFFGASNLALRVPSLLFAIAAPILIFFKGHPDRDTRLLWTAIVALWVPGVFYATEARSYTLLFVLGTLQVISFTEMLRSPDVRRTAAWCAVTAALVLTHYYTAAVSAFQMLAYLAMHRQAALRNWPAAIFFVPAFIWASIHLPLLFRFSSDAVAWQSILTLADVSLLPEMLFGPRKAALIIVAALGTWGIYSIVRRAPVGFDRIDALAAGASMAALILIYAIGFIRPSFTFRYLMPVMPGVLLGLAVVARQWARLWSPLPYMLLAVMLVACTLQTKRAAADPTLDWRNVWSWQDASTSLGRAGARRLFFFWDNPTTALGGGETLLGEEEMLSRTGAFFLDRAGYSVPTRAVVLAGRGNVDPNPLLLKLATQPKDALIWIYDLKVGQTLAARHPPRIAELDPRWRCRNDGHGLVGIVSCFRHH